MFDAVSLCLLAVAAVTIPGCAFHYYDAESGTEQIWGLGRVVIHHLGTSGGVRAFVTEVSTIGVSLGDVQREHYFTLGWDRRTRVEMPTDGVLCLQWPKDRLMDVRIGSIWPHPAMVDGTEGVSECRAN